MQQGHYSARQFARDVDANVRKYPSESEVLRQVKPLLEKLIRSASSVPVQAFTPRGDRFAMNLIHMPKDEMFSISGGVWHPGQTTPIHDDLTWALIGVYDGEERETLFRRIDDGSNPKKAKLEKVNERSNKKGQVTVLGHTGIHRVDNVSLKTALSIHISARDPGNTDRHS